jgi:CheY-like chemotaxis protein
MSDFKLLVVEDEEQLRDVIVETLEPIVAQIMTASNGQEALEFLENESFDATF